jgi:protein HOOK3
LDDAEAKVSDLSEKNSSLADELDISNAKATQLKKAEATVLAYRRKLEGAGMMNQQMSELENQSAKYLGQIVDLEMEAKKIPELQKNLDDATREFKKVQKENIDFAEKVVAKTANIAKLKTELSASVTAKKMAEEELTELRSMQHLDQDDVDRDVNMTGLSLTSVQSVTDVREKVMRLEIENKTLQKQLDATVVASAPVPTNDTSMMVDDATVKALENEIEQLQAELKKKNAATAKLASDKDKLESYTKKTLSKFQEKYLVALQECKAKLKEKHDKIEALEMCSASEISNQKKE